MKKILALVLVLVMMTLIGTAAYADSTIRINRDSSWDSGADSAKATYTYYKIFDAAITTAAEVDEATGELSSNDGVVVYTISGDDAAAKVAALPAIFTAKLAADGKYYITLTDDSTSAADIVSALATMVAANPDLFPGTEVTSSDNPVVLNVGSDGYYYIEASNGKDAAVQTIGEVTITEKNDYPTVSKEQSKTTSGYAADEVEVEIGTYINYQITVHIPTDATKAIVIADNLSDGLAYDSTTGLTLSPSVEYTTAASTDAGYDADATWQIKLSESVVEANRGSDIVITYRAQVTADALTDTERENEVTLTYDNGNYVLTDSTNYTTYYGGIEKIDGADASTKLEGVKFTVTVDGEPFNVTKDGDYYIPGGASNEVVTDENGLIIIRGLDPDKTYTLTETETNEGYNLLETPKDLTLEEDADGAYDAKDDYDQIENNKGLQLPSTGGIGTTLFYVVGGLMVTGAVVVLVSKKRTEE